MNAACSLAVDGALGLAWVLGIAAIFFAAMAYFALGGGWPLTTSFERARARLRRSGGYGA